jgi:hypothetical protein
MCPMYDIRAIELCEPDTQGGHAELEDLAVGVRDGLGEAVDEARQPRAFE